MATITDLSQLDLNATYSYADYAKWQFDERVELLRGKIFPMTPAPNVRHQRVSGNIFYLFRTHFKNKECQLFPAPFDVRLHTTGHL